MIDIFGFAVPEIVLVVVGVLWLVFTIFGISFQIAMFFHALHRKFKSRKRKIIWTIANLIIPYVSLYYYCLVISDKPIKKFKKKTGIDLHFILRTEWVK